MQFSSIFTLAASLALVSAAPASRRAATGQIVFHGAADAQYPLTVPLDGTVVTTNNALSISTVSSDTINVATDCVLHTVDFTPALVLISANTWAVGPPQTVISVACKTGGNGGGSPNSISIEFDGADPDQGAKYSLNVPLDGSVVPTNNALSISTLVSTYAALPQKCHFDYVDYQAALVLIRPNTWAVGPPQTIRSVSCTA